MHLSHIKSTYLRCTYLRVYHHLHHTSSTNYTATATASNGNSNIKILTPRVST